MESATLLRYIALALFSAALVTSVFFRARADRSSGRVDRSAERPLIRTLLSLMGFGFFILLTLALAYPPLMAWAAIPGWPLVLRWLGVVLMLLILPCLAWTLSSLGNNITRTVKTRSDHQLVTSGPYRFIRHPLYTFASSFFIGAILVAGSWVLLLVALPAMWALLSRTPQEESLLESRFGQQYRDYMQHTGRYFPRLTN